MLTEPIRDKLFRAGLNTQATSTWSEVAWKVGSVMRILVLNTQPAYRGLKPWRLVGR